MKVFEVRSNFMFSHYAQYATVEEARQYYADNIIFVEAPDYVFEGWGYDPDETGDARFIKPTPPEGWLYDDETGTFYPEDELPPSEQPTYEELLTMYRAIEKGMTE